MSSSRNHFPIIAFCVLCLGVTVLAFNLGRKSDQKQRDKHSGGADGERTGEKLSTIGGSSIRSTKAKTPVLADAARADFSPGEGWDLQQLTDKITRAGKKPRLSVDPTALASIAALGEDAFPDFAQQLAGSSGTSRKELLIAALGRWAVFDPQAAADFAMQNFSGYDTSEALAAVFLSWGASDPQAALSWFEKTDSKGGLSPRASISRALSKLFYAWARDDAPAAAAAAQIASGRSAAFYAWIGIAGLTTDDTRRDSALDAAVGVDDEAARAKAISQVVGEWAWHDPAAAAAWVDETGLRDGKTEWSIAQRWEKLDAEANANWLVAGSEGEALDKKLSMALNGWSRSDLEAAATWLEEFGPTDSSIAIIANGYSSIDLEKSIAWADRASEEKRDEVIIGALAEAKMRKNDIDLKPYLESGSLDAEEMAKKIDERYQMRQRF